MRYPCLSQRLAFCSDEPSLDCLADIFAEEKLGMEKCVL